MRIFFLCIGGLITSIGGLLSSVSIFRWLDQTRCLRNASQKLVDSGLLDCGGPEPALSIGIFVGLVFLSVGLFVVYKNIYWSSQPHSGWKNLIWVVALIPGFIAMCLFILYVVLFFLVLYSNKQVANVRPAIPEDAESAPFYAYDYASMVNILDYALVTSARGVSVKGVLQNNASVPITYVRLKLACGNGQDISFVVGSRKKTIRSLNRMTDQYKDREYEVPEAIAPGEKYHFEYEMNDATVTSACSLSADGWTDYGAINE